MSTAIRVYEPTPAIANHMRVGKLAINYRTNSTDENAIKEVYERGCYRRITFNFDVMSGEKWLDIGSHIGAFATYCLARGAQVTCYEPDTECFRLLKQNARRAVLHNIAVTASREKTLPFFKNRNPNDTYRGTIFGSRGYQQYAEVPNRYAAFLRTQKFDGVKIDAEGSEFGLIDNWLLPHTKKLVLEYHGTSKDRSVKNFVRRMRIIERHFERVVYPGSIEAGLKAGKPESKCWPYTDFLVFAWGPKPTRS